MLIVQTIVRSVRSCQKKGAGDLLNPSKGNDNLKSRIGKANIGKPWTESLGTDCIHPAPNWM